MTHLANSVMVSLLVLAANHGSGRTWDFENTETGQLPSGWSATRTGEGPGSVWKVVEDADAPRGKKALAQVSPDGPRPVFNVCVCGDVQFRDIQLSVAFKAVAGKIDQGGGPVWRFRDANNYYIARMNPLEDNFRVYKVVAGKRTQLASANVKVPAGQWHRIGVSHVTNRIRCFLDGKLYMDVRDETLPDAGKIGLWTKADATTCFDDLSAEPPGAASLPADQPAQASLPGIDCPLRRAGIDPTKLKPFEEVEKYIRFLERPDRAKWQKPDEVVKALGLKGSETVADLGAGSGYFTFRLSKALPQGRVIAIDSQPEMVRHVHRKARTECLANVTGQVATPDDPQLPRDADLVFVCDVLMHVRNRAAWLKTIHDQMRSSSRLVLIDFKEGDLPEGPPESIKVPKAEILRLCQQAGFQPQADHADLLPYQQFLVFERP